MAEVSADYSAPFGMDVHLVLPERNAGQLAGLDSDKPDSWCRRPARAPPPDVPPETYTDFGGHKT